MGNGFSSKVRHWAKSYDCGAGDILIGLNKKASIFWDPGPIFEFFMLNPSVWYRFQPDMVRSDSCLSGGQEAAELGKLGKSGVNQEIIIPSLHYHSAYAPHGRG